MLQEGAEVKDVGLLYRQRYLDFIVHPEKVELFRRRARIIAAMRRFFDERGYVECDTRMLLSTNVEATARPHRTHPKAPATEPCRRNPTDRKTESRPCDSFLAAETWPGWSSSPATRL